jgi:hypothetical protein
VAGAAICIAWQRSLATDRQIGMQSNVNKLSNFYSMQAHILTYLEEHKNTTNTENLVLKNKRNIFYSIFENPSNGEFSPKSSFENDLKDLCRDHKNILNLTFKLKKTFDILPKDIANDYYNSIGRGAFLSYIDYINDMISMHCNPDNNYSKILQLTNELNTKTINFLKKSGFEMTENFDKFRKDDPVKNAEIIMDLLEILNNLVKSSPISEDEQSQFDLLFFRTPLDINIIDQYLVPWVEDEWKEEQ